MKKTGIILLSGGLDSYISLDIAIKQINIKTALTFNYGQKAFEDELFSSKKMCKLYNIKQEIIELPFLKKITKNALTEKKNNNFNDVPSIWIPNRNGLFLNIAACFCDKYKFDYIVFGANKEEARHFPDNSEDFINLADQYLTKATIQKPKVIAPCLQFDKIQIINYAIDNNLDLRIIKSCYDSKKHNKKHCGMCKSCKLLLEGLKKSKNPELIKDIFDENIVY